MLHAWFELAAPPARGGCGLPILLALFYGFILLAIYKVIVTRRLKRRALAYAAQQAERRKQAGPSIYSLIRRQLDERPDRLLDETAIPSAPPPPAKSKNVPSILRRASAGKIADWRVLEEELRGVQASSDADPMVNARVKRLFWDLARGSADVEAVKWGLGVGSLELTDEELPDLLLLARHSEFAGLAAAALRRNEAFKRRLVELLPLTRGRAIARIIGVIVEDPELVADPDVRKSILLCGMENCGAIPGEIALAIAPHIDLAAFTPAAAHDDRLRSAVDLFTERLSPPAPPTASGSTS